MSRVKGHDRAATQARQEAEGARFNIAFVHEELALQKLRIEQAIRRRPELAELLLPAIENAEEIKRLIKEITQ
jgi:hypothetical protein